MKQDMIRKRKKFLNSLKVRESKIEKIKIFSQEHANEAYHEKHKRQEELTEQIKQNLIENQAIEDHYREELNHKIKDKSIV